MPTYEERVKIVEARVYAFIPDKAQAQELLQAVIDLETHYRKAVDDSDYLRLEAEHHRANAERLMKELEMQSISNDDVCNEMLRNAGLRQDEMTQEQVRLQAELEVMSPFIFNVNAHKDAINERLELPAVKKLTLDNAKKAL